MSFPEAFEVRYSHLQEGSQVPRMEDDGHNPTLYTPIYQPRTVIFNPDRLDNDLSSDMSYHAPSHPQAQGKLD